MQRTQPRIFTAAIIAILAAACPGPAPKGPGPEPTPIEVPDAAPATAPPAADAATAAVPDEPEPDPTAALLADETAAYERAKPVFAKYCANCHEKGRGGAKAKTLDHFDMTTYPFGGHHAKVIGAEIREVLGATGKKPTMPKTRPGSVKGDDLALVLAWADAFDAADAAGAHAATAAPPDAHAHDAHAHDH